MFDFTGRHPYGWPSNGYPGPQVTLLLCYEFQNIFGGKFRTTTMFRVSRLELI